MDIKIRNIVRVKGTNEVYEVSDIIGELLLCKPVNTPIISNFTAIPIKNSEVEVIMDKETDIFNILFKNDENT